MHTFHRLELSIVSASAHSFTGLLPPKYRTGTYSTLHALFYYQYHKNSVSNSKMVIHKAFIPKKYYEEGAKSVASNLDFALLLVDNIPSC